MPRIGKLTDCGTCESYTVRPDAFLSPCTLVHLGALHCGYFLVAQEEAELGVVMDNMTAGQELLRQKEDRLRVLENALLGGMVSYYRCYYTRNYLA